MLKYNKNSRVGEKNCGSFTRLGCGLGFVLLIIVLCGLKVTGYHAMQSRGSGGLCIDSGSLYKVVCCCRISRDAIARERGKHNGGGMKRAGLRGCVCIPREKPTRRDETLENPTETGMFYDRVLAAVYIFILFMLSNRQ